MPGVELLSCYLPRNFELWLFAIKPIARKRQRCSTERPVADAGHLSGTADVLVFVWALSKVRVK
jgi:hypothetical protein